MSLFFGVAPRGVPRGVRNWKQACPIFFGVAPRGVPRGVPRFRKYVSGRFAETLDSGPQDNWKIFFTVVGLDNLDIFFARKNPDLGLGRAPMPDALCGAL